MCPVMGSDRSGVVVVARGTSEAELRRVAQILHDGGVPFQVEEGVGGNPERPLWRWDVLVGTDDLDDARRLLSAEPETPGPRDPAPGPLFESSGSDLLRVGLMLISFGLAGGLWFLSCVN